MTLPQVDIRCSKCAHEFEAVPKRDFLGFRRAVCPACSQVIDLPLTAGYRWAYLLLLTVAIIAIGGFIPEANFGPASVFLLFLTGSTLVKDWRLRRRLRSKD